MHEACARPFVYSVLVAGLGFASFICFIRAFRDGTVKSTSLAEAATKPANRRFGCSGILGCVFMALACLAYFQFIDPREDEQRVETAKQFVRESFRTQQDAGKLTPQINLAHLTIQLNYLPQQERDRGCSWVCEGTCTCDGRIWRVTVVHDAETGLEMDAVPMSGRQ